MPDYTKGLKRTHINGKVESEIMHAYVFDDGEYIIATENRLDDGAHHTKQAKPEIKICTHKSGRLFICYDGVLEVEYTPTALYVSPGSNARVSLVEGEIHIEYQSHALHIYIANGSLIIERDCDGKIEWSSKDDVDPSRISHE